MRLHHKSLIKGFSGLKLLLLLGLLIVIASAISYYLLKLSNNGLPGTSNVLNQQSLPSGKTTDVEDLDKELKNIDEGSPEADVKDIEVDASSL